MNKTLAWFTTLLVSLTSYTTHAQQKTTDANKSLLWRISGNKLTRTSYLFGTIHMICVEDYIWTNVMKQSLGKSAKVCFESNIEDPAVMQEAAAGMIDTSGKKLEEYFTPGQFAEISKYITDSLGMDIARFEHMKPIALQSLIGTSAVKCDNPISYEDSILKTAENANKEIIGLEDPGEVLAALEKIPADTVVKQLMDELESGDKSDSEYSKLVAAYKSQDLPRLYSLIMAGSEAGDQMGIFLDDRNKKWIPRMSKEMKQSSVFFAVGAGHLWGDNGVIHLLRKAGYTVVPMK